MEDAKVAGLWGKRGTWTLYPKRMLQHRARGFAAKDAFPDALYGLMSEGEAVNVAEDSKVIHMPVVQNKGMKGLEESLGITDVIEGEIIIETQQIIVNWKTLK